MAKINNPQQALAVIQSQCSRQELCEFDIRKKLVRWQIEETSHHEIIASLIAQKFIDQKRYARAYSLDKLRYQGWGRYKLTRMLKQKKLSDSEIKYGLSFIENTEYQQILLKLINQKLSKLSEKDVYKKRIKVYNFLQNRGFEISLAQKLIDKLLKT